MGLVVVVVVVVVAVVAVVAWRLLRSPSDDPDEHAVEPPRRATIVKQGPAVLPEPRERTATDGLLRLEGQVIDEQQRPVAGAHVAIQERDGKTAISDAGGSFVIEGLHPRQYMLVAATDELASALTFAQLSETSEPVTIHVRAAGALIVSVVDAATKVPIATARITDASRREHVTDEAGSATIRGLGDPGELSVRAPGYAHMSTTARVEPVGEPAKLTVELRKGAAVSGTVIGPDDKPVALASVYLSTRDARLWARADDAGAWTIDGVVAGTYAVTATSETFAAAAAMRLTVDGTTPKTGVVVRVELGAQLVGIVLDPAGKPVANAVVNFTGNSFSSAETTDRDGKFAFLGTPIGHFVIWGRHQARASRELTVELIDKQRIEVMVSLEDSSIAGRVVDSSGDPIAGVHVVASPKVDGRGGRTGEDVTNSKGEFDFGGVPPGVYEVRGRRPEAKSYDYSEPVVAKAGDRSVEVVIADGTTVIGRVLLDGKPMTYYALVISEPGEMNWRQSWMPTTVRTADGRFREKGVAPGKRVVVVAGPGFARKVIEDVEVTEDEVTDLGDINVDRGLTIKGRVIDYTGAPVAGAAVAVEQMAGVRIGDAKGLSLALQGDGSSISAPDGTFQVLGIPPVTGPRARNQISARHPQRGTAPPRELPAGDATVELVLLATGAIDGKVVGASDYQWVRAAATEKGGAHESAELASDGSFTFEGLPAGDYDLTPVRNGSWGFRQPPIRVTVLANQRITATVTHLRGIHLTIRSNEPCADSFLFAPDDVRGWRSHQPCNGNFAELVDVQPGAYRACLDRNDCKQIVVTPQPARQTVVIER